MNGLDDALVSLSARGAASASAYPPIGDYAIIGDCRTSALIAKSGAIDWLCLPNFSSGSVFAAILDRCRGGRFTLCPEQAHRSERSYLGKTALLVTEFTTSHGRVRVTDSMSINDGDQRWSAHIQPQRELIRRVEGIEGTVEMVSVIEPRPDFARQEARVSHRKGSAGCFRLHRRLS